MIRLLGVQITDSARIEYALTNIYGIGFKRAKKILSEVKISPEARANTLSEEQLKSLQEYIEKNLKVEEICVRKCAKTLKDCVKLEHTVD